MARMRSMRCVMHRVLAEGIIVEVDAGVSSLSGVASLRVSAYRHMQAYPGERRKKRLTGGSGIVSIRMWTRRRCECRVIR
jgi:hypothetical protein